MTSGHGRAVSVVLAVVVAASAITAGVAAFSATASGADANPVKFVYVDAGTGNVTFVRADGTTVDAGVPAQIVGPMADVDDDGLLEAPFVQSDGSIHVVDPNGSVQFVASGGETAKTKLTVGDWTGDGTFEVLYENTSDSSYLYYANLTGTPTRLTDAKSKAVLGVVDFDGDGTRDVVYVGGSGVLKYYTGTTVVETGYGNFGSNNGYGVGAPADFYRTGEYWVPAATGSGNLELANDTAAVRSIGTSESVQKAPVAGVDWADNGRLEVLYLNDGVVKYAYLNGSTGTVADASGTEITAVPGAGVAGVVVDTALTLPEFTATATGDQNVTVNVTASKVLDALNVTLSGPENATLTLAAGEFSTDESSAPYTYTATYDASTDGAYTARLVRAESTDGDVIRDDRSANATVDDVVPRVESVSLSDGTNDDGVVAVGDDVVVNASVTGDVANVTANLSAFGVGNVTLNETTGGNYTATATVTEAATDGVHNVTVVARDGQGNANATRTDSLTVDTTPPSVSVGPDRTVTVGTAVSFDGDAIDATTSVVSYHWDFGDGAEALGETVSHTYDATGTFTVALTVTDAAGNLATALVNVTVEAAETTTTTDTATTVSDTTTDTTIADTTENTVGDTTTDTTIADTTTPTTRTPTTPTTTAPTTTTIRSTSRSSTATRTAASTTITTTRTTAVSAGEATETTRRATDRRGDPVTSTPGASGGSSGFGVVLAVVALLATALVVRRD